MIKLLSLFFSYLLIFGNLIAQTDSNTHQAAKDTNTRKDTNSGNGQELFVPGSQPKDSGASVHKAHKKKTPAADSASSSLYKSPSDSVAGPRTTPAGQDSVVRAAGAASSPAPVILLSLTPEVMAVKAVLANNPFFNFEGTPVVEGSTVHRANSKDTLFYLLVSILFYFALIRILFEKYFGNLLTLFFRVSIRQQQIREQVLQTPLPSLLLNILFIVTGGLYACYLTLYYHFAKGINFWILYLNCMLVLGAVYLIKFLLLKFCGWVFNINRATDTYIFIVFLVNKMLGIFLLPFLIIISFSDQIILDIFVTISLVMIFIFWGYRVLAAFRPIRNEIKLTPFHFFLYLCAFEIAPLLLIYKVLLAYLEKAS